MKKKEARKRPRATEGRTRRKHTEEEYEEEEYFEAIFTLE